MTQKCPIFRLTPKSLISNSFALRSHSHLTTKDQTTHHWNITLNPTRGKGPPGSDQSPGETSSFRHSLFNPNLFTTMKINSIKQIKNNNQSQFKFKHP